MVGELGQLQEEVGEAVGGRIIERPVLVDGWSLNCGWGLI